MTKIAVIGAGYWGKNLIRNFAELGVLSYVCDKDSNLANKLATEHGAKTANWQDVLNDDNIQGIVIATPAATHAALAKEAILSGKDVFVEKPIALNVDDATELCELASKHKRILMVGHLLRYHPAFITLKKMVDDGKLGRLQYLYSNRLNLGKIRREEDILWSFAPHDISMILSLIGTEPESVHATGGCFLHKTIADVTTTHLHFPGGQQAHIFVSWLHPFKQQKMVVVGDKGMATFDDSEVWDNKLLLYPHEINWKEGAPVPTKADAQPIPLTKEEPLRNECAHFIDCINTRHTPKTNGWDALQVLKVLDKASNSLKQGNTPSHQHDTSYYAHESATIDPDVRIGKNTKIWHYSHIINKTTIGNECTVGQNVMIGPNVAIGNHCKIQNNVSIYEGVTLEDNVFCGPSCVFTNVTYPRADINRRNEFDRTHVAEGVTIGANATIVCGTNIGARSFIGAGAVVTKDVPPHALMVGNPAKQIGWVSHSGERLDDTLTCPRDGTKYRITENNQLEKAA